MRKKKFSTLTLMCVPMLACGGTGNNNKITLTDAAGSGHVYKDAPGQEACEAKPSYSPTFGSNDQQQAFAGSNAMQAKVYYLGNLSEANPVDLLDIELWIGGGDFGSALANGTYNLANNGDTDWNMCAACALVWPQVAVGSDGSLGIGSDYIANHQYMAKSGTMTLTSVATNVTGTLSNVALRHVLFDGSGNQTDAPDGCTTTITAVSFTAAIKAAALVGKTSDGTNLRVRLRNRRQ